MSRRLTVSLPTTDVGIWYQAETLVFFCNGETPAIHEKRNSWRWTNSATLPDSSHSLSDIMWRWDNLQMCRKKSILSSWVKVNNLHNCSCEKLFSAPQSIIVWILNPKSPQALPRRREVWKNWFNASQQTHQNENWVSRGHSTGWYTTYMSACWKRSINFTFHAPAKLTTSVKRSRKRLNSLMTFLCCKFFAFNSIWTYTLLSQKVPLPELVHAVRHNSHQLH